MHTIHKFPLKTVDEQFIEVHESHAPLTVQMQGTVPTLWCAVDDATPKVQRKVLVVGTGNPLPKSAFNYVGTVQSGMFVWHIFIE